MWYYQKIDNGYKIIKKNKKNSWNFIIPYILHFKNNVIYWNDTMIIKLIEDLNNDKIDFYWNNELQNKYNGIVGFTHSHHDENNNYPIKS